MIRSSKLVAGVALRALGTSAGAATTITFESFGGGTSFSGSGVTITAEGQNILATNSPNGTVGIIAKGTPRSELTATFDLLTNAVHRIDKAVVIREVTSAGFKLVGEGHFLHRPADDHKASIFDRAIQGHTDQFALKFVKPRR